MTMQFRNDDDLYSVDNVFLGPKEWTLPWRARYIAYVLGFPIFLVAMAIVHRLGFQLGFTAVAYSLLATVGATTAICRKVTYERPVRTIAATFTHEVAAPRGPAGHRCVLEPSRVPVRRNGRKINDRHVVGAPRGAAGGWRRLPGVRRGR